MPQDVRDRLAQHRRECLVGGGRKQRARIAGPDLRAQRAQDLAGLAQLAGQRQSRALPRRGDASAVHIHNHDDETFLLLDGAMTVWCGPPKRAGCDAEPALTSRFAKICAMLHAIDDPLGCRAHQE
jgi:hypothetical protein